jgi:alkanesulfonate monooxygenase SsuD/methylene tetrahydromethanopterin reductase-like flavin-dependent oxidoreductase (luciferase family)
MRIGIGLPAAVPGTDAMELGEWAERSERLGFESLGVLDRLVYDNLDPLVALGAAAARTERSELVTAILGVPYRGNAVVVGKQLASVHQISGGRLVAGLALGGWPEDYAASDVPLAGRGARFEEMIGTIRRVWGGELEGAGGPMPAPPAGSPPLLLGAIMPVGFARVAALADGWVAPFFGYQLLVDGMATLRRAWAEAGRAGRPRVVVERYFCLGDDADAIADEYLMHYYGAEYFAPARADTLTSGAQVETEVARIAEAGVDDLILFPCSGELEQVEMLAEALDATSPARRRPLSLSSSRTAS